MLFSLSGLVGNKAGVVELADAPDSKSGVPCGHGGSSPPSGTNNSEYLQTFII